jgi:hypothetical protein
MAENLYPDYSEYCRDANVKPISRSHLGRSIRRLKVASGREGASGAKWGLRLRDVMAVNEAVAA